MRAMTCVRLFDISTIIYPEFDDGGRIFQNALWCSQHTTAGDIDPAVVSIKISCSNSPVGPEHNTAAALAGNNIAAVGDIAAAGSHTHRVEPAADNRISGEIFALAALACAQF